MSNILITGGAGYIGSHICEVFENTSHKIYILDNLINGYKELINKKAKFINSDIKNFSKLNQIIVRNKIDTIIHLAAYSNVSEAEKNKNKYFDNNIKGTKNIVRASKNTCVKNIIFSSSCSIYGTVRGAVSEYKKPSPEGYYAYTKYKGEEFIKKKSKSYGYNYAILRYFNVAGASPSKKIGQINSSLGSLFKNVSIQALKKKPKIHIYGDKYNTKDGTCIRDYIHVSDLAAIHVKIIEYLGENNKSIILNCGYGSGYSVKEIINIFKKIKKNVVVIIDQKRLGDITQVFANTKKLNRLLKFKPKYNNIKKILLTSINWEKNINLKKKIT